MGCAFVGCVVGALCGVGWVCAVAWVVRVAFALHCVLDDPACKEKLQAAGLVIIAFRVVGAMHRGTIHNNRVMRMKYG